MKPILKSWTSFLFAALLLTISFTSCKKKTSEETPQPAEEQTPTGMFELHIHSYVGPDEFEFDSTYTMNDGRKLLVTEAQLYMSNIQLVKLDGSVYSVPGRIILKNQDSETYIVGKVPAGNYATMRFNVGLDASTNQKEATAASELNTSAMWFGATAQPQGYVFANFQGKIDTTAAKNGALVPFSYKLGTSATYKQIAMPEKKFTISPNSAQFLHMTIDFYKLFEGIQLNDPNNLTVGSTTDNSKAVAVKLQDNLSKIFDLE